MMTTAARRTSSFSEVRGWSSLEKVATAETARVSARAYGDDSRTACWALTTREAAMSSMARVIFFVALTDRMRCRYSRICAPMSFRLSWCLLGGVRSALLLDDLLLVGVHRLAAVLALVTDRHGLGA